MNPDQFCAMRATLDEVAHERARQERIHGPQNRPPAQYAIILHEEVGEVSKAICEAEFTADASYRLRCLQELRSELIQVAAVAVAMVECLNRNELSGVNQDPAQPT